MPKPPSTKPEVPKNKPQMWAIVQSERKRLIDLFLS
jgi:hypothetical protein